MVPPAGGETSEPPMDGSLPGSRRNDPLGAISFTQFVPRPYLLEAMCSPVRRSTVKKYPFRAAVETSLRGRPLITASIRIGVCAESQSCMSCGDVWKYHAILPVSTFTATSAHVNRLSPSPRPTVYAGIGLPVPKMYSFVSGS